MRQERALVDVIPKLLEHLEERAEPRAALYWLLVVIGETLECESTAIRWKAGEDYTYYVSRGFSQEFLQHESSLYERDSADLILQHPDGTPQLACMCGAVVECRTDPSRKANDRRNLFLYLEPDPSWTAVGSLTSEKTGRIQFLAAYKRMGKGLAVFVSLPTDVVYGEDLYDNVEAMADLIGWAAGKASASGMPSLP